MQFSEQEQAKIRVARYPIWDEEGDLNLLHMHLHPSPKGNAFRKIQSFLPNANHVGGILIRNMGRGQFYKSILLDNRRRKNVSLSSVDLCSSFTVQSDKCLIMSLTEFQRTYLQLIGYKTATLVLQIKI